MATHGLAPSQRLRLVNHSGQRSEDARVSVTCEWHWKNALHPGVDNPGWNAKVELPMNLAPGDAYKFHVPAEHPLTGRTDGYFQPSVVVARYTTFTAPAN